MKIHQTKRKRPRIETAHQHLKGDARSSVTTLFVSHKDRGAAIEALSEKLLKLVKHEFPRTGTLEYAILKAHLIVEYAITQYIQCFASVAVTSKDINFTFRQKLEIAYLMGFGAHDEVLLPTIEKLNKARNEVAHTFFLDRCSLDELLRINSANYHNFKQNSDKERIRSLRILCGFICGQVAGEINGTYASLVVGSTRPLNTVAITGQSSGDRS